MNGKTAVALFLLWYFWPQPETDVNVSWTNPGTGESAPLDVTVPYEQWNY